MDLLAYLQIPWKCKNQGHHSIKDAFAWLKPRSQTEHSFHSFITQAPFIFMTATHS